MWGYKVWGLRKSIGTPGTRKRPPPFWVGSIPSTDRRPCHSHSSWTLLMDETKFQVYPYVTGSIPQLWLYLKGNVQEGNGRVSWGSHLSRRDWSRWSSIQFADRKSLWCPTLPDESLLSISNYTNRAVLVVHGLLQLPGEPSTKWEWISGWVIQRLYARVARNLEDLWIHPCSECYAAHSLCRWVSICQQIDRWRVSRLGTRQYNYAANDHHSGF